jgi:hypothetical protein
MTQIIGNIDDVGRAVPAMTVDPTNPARCRSQLQIQRGFNNVDDIINDEAQETLLRSANTKTAFSSWAIFTVSFKGSRGIN